MSLQQYLSKTGPKINLSEIKKLEETFGEKGIKQLGNKDDLKFGGKAQSWLDKYKEKQQKKEENETVPTLDPGEQEIYASGISFGEDGKYNIKPGRYSEAEFSVLGQGILDRLRGDIEIEKQQIAGLTSTKVADIQAQAAIFGYSADERAKKYIADQDLLKGTRVAEIQAKNNLDLQAIINSGLKEVEGIRGQTQRDVATIQGEYGVKEESTRQSGQKDIARIGAEAGFRNALIGAFSF